MGALYERNRVFVHSILRHGLEPSRSLITAAESFRSIRGPRIVGTFHVGAVHAFGPALERLASPVVAFRSAPIFAPGGALEILSTDGDEQLRAGALHRALLHLRGGGVVFLALDIATGEAIETRCLGHNLRIAPGAFALARWTGAPVELAVARWNGHRIGIETGDSVSTPGEAAGWLERYLLERPSEISLALLRNLLGVS